MRKSSIANDRAVQIFGFNPCGLGLKEYAINMAKARKLENSPYLYEQLPLIKALLYGQTTHNQEITIQKRDQTQITLSANASPLIGKEGNKIGALAIFEDITDRKKAEKQLRSVKDQYTLLFNSIHEGFALYEAIYENDKLNDLLVLEINTADAKCSGVNYEAQTGKSWRQIWPTIEDSVFDFYRKVDQTGEPLSLEHFSKLTHSWYEINIQKVAKGRFAAVFKY